MGGDPSGGEGKQTFQRKSEQTVWEGCRLCKNASVQALGGFKDSLKNLYMNLYMNLYNCTRHAGVGKGTFAAADLQATASAADPSNIS